MKKEEKTAIIKKIMYELEEGSHTFTMCNCNRHGCRGIKCWECLLEELSK